MDGKLLGTYAKSLHGNAGLTASVFHTAKTYYDTGIFILRIIYDVGVQAFISLPLYHLT